MSEPTAYVQALDRMDGVVSPEDIAVVEHEVDELRAKVDRLHDENAAMRPIVEAVARGRLVRGEFPHEEWIDPDGAGAGELIIAAIQARALLEKEAQE